MQQSVAAQKMREAYIAHGGENIKFNYGSGEAAIDTILNPATADLSSTAVQIGGFAGATIINLQLPVLLQGHLIEGIA